MSTTDQGYFSKYRLLMAKTGRNPDEEWLPLWMHLKDTAGIMKKLANKWIPESVLAAAGLNSDQFLATAIFLGAVHDIGKATSYFQSIITQSCPQKYEEITGSGFVVNKKYRSAGKTPHAHAGQWILQNGMNEFKVHESQSMVVGAHHGKPIHIDFFMGEPDMIRAYPVNFFGSEENDSGKALWEASWNMIMLQAMKLAGFESTDELPDLTLEAQVLLSGLLITADWIASNTDYFPLLTLDDYGDESFYPQRVNDGWKRVTFPEGWHSEIHIMDEKLFEIRFGFLPNEVQAHMLRAVNGSQTPGIFILEAQMGIGKTEAALGAAEVLACRKESGGIFFGLPTQATSNGLFRRLYNWGAKVSEETVSAVRLAHGSAEFNEEYHQLALQGSAYVDEDGQAQDRLGVHPWFQGNKRALLADFVIGTVDQFLMASLKRKHFMLRHIGLAGKVVVIDECHAYDAYMNEYLERSLQWMAAYGVPVILLSATLPSERRKTLIDCYVKAYSKYRLGKRKPEITYTRSDWKENTVYPLLTWSDGETVKQADIQQDIPDKTVKLRYVDTIPDMIRLMDERLQDGGCGCIIANTVKAAQEIYTACKESLEHVRLILYHAQFTMPDRYEKEKLLLEKMGKASDNSDRNRLVLIGTQVLEQSLDYDADIMVTQLCPIDLLLQRIGRLHRHNKRDGDKENYSRPGRLRKPECIILRDGDGSYDSGSSAVYGEYLLMRTGQILGTEIKIPGDIPYMVQKVYDQKNDLELTDEIYKTAKEKYINTLKTKKQGAKRYLLNKPSQKEISNMLDTSEESSEKAAEASVRDSVSSIEVLLMKENENGDILFVKDDSYKMPVLSSYRTPDHEEGRMIAMQRLRLPHIFVAAWNKKEIIEELEDRNRKRLAEWQLSPWLRGELILLLGQDNRTELNGYLLSYSFEKGLEYKRKEEEDAGKRI